MRLRWGPGPVFAYEWLTATRRWQVYALRSGFVAAILLGMVIVRNNEQSLSGLGADITIETAARWARAFFGVVVSIELTTVLLVAPAATAGAVCLDKSRGTLDHLLATDLSNAEIVVGKLGVRLFPVLGLVASVVPIMALASLLGGIDPDTVTGSFLTAAACAVLAGSLALTLSVWGRKTHEVLILTYLILCGWLFAPVLLDKVADLLSSGPPAGGPGAVVAALVQPTLLSNPYALVFGPYPVTGGGGLAASLGFLAACLVLSGLLLGLATWRVRAVAMRQAGVPAVRPRAHWRALSRRVGSALGVARPAWLPGPSLDGNPVLWREWHRTRPSRMSALAWNLYLGVGLCLTVLAFRGASPDREFLAAMTAIEVTVGLLLLTTSGVTSLSEERVRGSLDVLLCTPLSNRAILAGKWWGTFGHCRRVMIWPVAAAGVLAWRSGHWREFCAFAGLLLAYGAGITSLGLAVATWVRRPERAVVLGVAAYAGLSFGWALLTYVVFRHPDPYGRPIMMGTPIYGTLLGMSLAGPEPMPIPGNPRLGLIGALCWTVVDLGIAAILFRATLAIFDRRLGRARMPAGRSS